MTITAEHAGGSVRTIDPTTALVTKAAVVTAAAVPIPLLIELWRWFHIHINVHVAVKTQIWIAISIYVLVAIVKKRLNLDHSLYSILQILSVTLMEKPPILQLVSRFNESEKMLDDGKQLILFD